MTANKPDRRDAHFEIPADSQRCLPSYKVKIDKNKCKGCGLCVFYCPVKHLELSRQLNKKGVQFAENKKDNKCIGCGFCFLICPETCIEIYEKKARAK